MTDEKNMTTAQMTDEQMLALVGMTPGQVDRIADAAEDESQPDNIVHVYHGFHLADEDKPTKTITVRLSEDLLAMLTKQARRYGISRNEYIRRKLAA